MQVHEYWISSQVLLFNVGWVSQRRERGEVEGGVFNTGITNAN